MSEPPVPRAYARFAFFLTNCFILLLLLNLGLIPINKSLAGTTRNVPSVAPAPTGHPFIASPMPPPDHPDEGRPTPNKKRDADTLDTMDMTAYQGLPSAQVETMIDEMNDFGHAGSIYLPWVEFGPTPFTSQFVNILMEGSEFPYRKSLLDPTVRPDPQWPVLKVYVLGGSTTFGSRVSDDWTLPSYLWTALQKKAMAGPHPCRIELVNWGRTWYYSSQEVTLLRRLLRTGHKPDVVVFFDGLNDCNNWCTVGADKPVFTDKLAEIYHLNQFGKDWLSQYGWVPMVKFAFLVRHRFAPASPGAAQLTTQEDVDARASDILTCYRDNADEARDLCRKHGIRCYFFWQPVPFVRYDLRLHRVLPAVSPGIIAVFQKVYAGLEQTVPTTIDLAGAFETYGHRKVFVDMVHYNPPFHQYLAGLMASHIDVSPP